MILFYNLIYIMLITLTILFIINKLLNIKDQRFKIISYLVIISSILINFIFLNPNQSDYSENYLRLIVILALIVFIIILYKMIFKKNLKDIINNKKTTFNNTEINHNYHTNIETLDNSNTFNTSQTNNHLEQNNIVTNIHSKQSSQKKEKVDVMNSSENTNIKLSEEQLRKVYFFFIDNELLADYDLEFINFKDLFLKEQIRLKADVPTLRQLYNNLKIQKNIKFNNITNDFLIYFINSNDDQIYDYKQFTKDPKPTSGLNEEIKKLFKDF